MLYAGRVEPGMRVLEIGTGTGYTAALERAGYGEVRVITGDGAQGYPAGAPFDRVLSTVAAPRLPFAWVAQTRLPARHPPVAGPPVRAVPALG